jgi:glycerol kinase
VGFFAGVGDLESFWQKERVFEPNMPETRREELFAGWHEALRRARG